MAFSIRLTEQEKKIVDSYARLHSISLGEAFKQALFEKSKKNMTLPFLMTLMMNTKRAVKKADQSLIFGRNLTYELCCKNHSEI